MYSKSIAVTKSPLEYVCAEECELEGRCCFVKLRDRMRKTRGFIICNHDLPTVHLQKASLDQCALLPDDVTHAYRM